LQVAAPEATQIMKQKLEAAVVLVDTGRGS
jgi:hypothetical protein